MIWGGLASLRGQMKGDCAGVKLTNEMDRCVWTLTKTVKFTVKSVYGAIKARQVPCPF